MTPSPQEDDELERLVHQTLRGLPARRAPRSLEQRVLADIDRRAALPWWRADFKHWPLAARAVFLLVGVGMVKVALMASVWVMTGFDTAQFHATVAQPFSWMENGLAVINAITGFLDVIGRNIPPLWLYGGLAFLAAMYAALFGLGAAAYRALHIRSET